MYGALIVFCVPMPLIAGGLSDRLGRKPLIIAVYLGGAIGFVVFLLAGSSIVWLWVGIVLMGLFSFAESPQLQALLGDISPPATRDASYALYFTLAFGVGSLWVALYGVIIDRARRGRRRADRVRADGRVVHRCRAGDAAHPGGAAGPRERPYEAACSGERLAAARRTPDVAGILPPNPARTRRRARGTNGRPDPARRGRPLDPRGDRDRPAQAGFTVDTAADGQQASTASRPNRSTSSCST